MKKQQEEHPEAQMLEQLKQMEVEVLDESGESNTEDMGTNENKELKKHETNIIQE